MKRLALLSILLFSCCSKANGPRVLVDQGHHNRHRVGGTYKPFVKLLESDGYSVDAHRGAITPRSLDGVRLLVIPAALGTDDANTSPAFTAAEAGAIVDWVRGGGALLLITDHFPFGDAVRNLAAPFGVEMSCGMTFDPVQHDPATGDDSRLVFSRTNGLLAAHPITEGVDNVMTFTGQALRATSGTALLRLSDSAVNRAATPHVTRHGGDTTVNVVFGEPVPAKGWSQALALQYGKGRVVVLGEAAMATEQVDGGRPIGMNVPGTGNRRFVRNMIRWLVGGRPL